MACPRTPEIHDAHIQGTLHEKFGGALFLAVPSVCCFHILGLYQFLSFCADVVVSTATSIRPPYTALSRSQSTANASVTTCAPSVPFASCWCHHLLPSLLLFFTTAPSNKRRSGDSCHENRRVNSYIQSDTHGSCFHNDDWPQGNDPRHQTTLCFSERVTISARQ